MPILTGDPNCPEEVRKAKRIKCGIGQRASLGGGKEDFDLETVTFTGPSVIGDRSPDVPLIRDSSTGVAREAIVTIQDETSSTTSISASSSRNSHNKQARNSDDLSKKKKLQTMNDMQQIWQGKESQLERQQEREKDRKPV